MRDAIFFWFSESFLFTLGETVKKKIVFCLVYQKKQILMKKRRFCHFLTLFFKIPRDTRWAHRRNFIPFPGGVRDYHRNFGKSYYLTTKKTQLPTQKVSGGKYPVLSCKKIRCTVWMEKLFRIFKVLCLDLIGKTKKTQQKHSFFRGVRISEVRGGGSAPKREKIRLKNWILWGKGSGLPPPPRGYPKTFYRNWELVALTHTSFCACVWVGGSLQTATMLTEKKGLGHVNGGREKLEFDRQTFAGAKNWIMWYY